MFDRDYFRDKDFDPTPALQDVSFKWTDSAFPEFGKEELTQISQSFSNILCKASDFCSTYKAAERLLERTLREDEESIEIVRQLLDQGAAAALATKVKSDVIDISNQRFDLEIVAPLVEEKQFIRKHGVPVIEDFTASLPSREVRLLNRINEIKNRCMEVYPAMLDERVEELRDVAPTLHNRYWKMYREVLMKRVYSKELGEYLEASSRLEGTIIRSMLDGLEASAKAYNFWQTCRNEKGVLYSGKERPKPRDT